MESEKWKKPCLRLGFTLTHDLGSNVMKEDFTGRLKYSAAEENVWM
jgi:hypothetical protein